MVGKAAKHSSKIFYLGISRGSAISFNLTLTQYRYYRIAYLEFYIGLIYLFMQYKEKTE